MYPRRATALLRGRALDGTVERHVYSVADSIEVSARIVERNGGGEGGSAVWGFGSANLDPRTLRNSTRSFGWEVDLDGSVASKVEPIVIAVIRDVGVRIEHVAADR